VISFERQGKFVKIAVFAQAILSPGIVSIRPQTEFSKSAGHIKISPTVSGSIPLDTDAARWHSGRTKRNKVDRSPDSFASVQRRSRPANHLNPAEGRHIHFE